MRKPTLHDLLGISCTNCRALISKEQLIAFRNEQLVYMQCEKCGRGVTVQQIQSEQRLRDELNEQTFEKRHG